jgi:hypothetical protein
MRLLSRLACLSLFAAALAVGCSKEASTEASKDSPAPMEKDKTNPKDSPPDKKDKVTQPSAPSVPTPPKEKKGP